MTGSRRAPLGGLDQLSDLNEERQNSTSTFFSTMSKVLILSTPISNLIFRFLRNSPPVAEDRVTVHTKVFQFLLQLFLTSQVVQELYLIALRVGSPFFTSIDRRNY